MTTPRPGGGDPIRDAIVTAMDRLLAGTPLRSTGHLSISQLAIEAGVKRWHLTHQHLDLKELFQARVKAQGNTPEMFTKKLNEHEELKKKYADLRQHCADLEERLHTYATALNLLALENTALTASSTNASIVPLPRPQISP